MTGNFWVSFQSHGGQVESILGDGDLGQWLDTTEQAILAELAESLDDFDPKAIIITECQENKTMTGHTPGPWRLEYEDQRMTLKHKATGAVLAIERNISYEMADFIKQVANLSHERSAAPDLLAALEGTLQVLDRRLEQARQNAHYPSEFKPENSPSPSEAKKREQARAAIAKAKDSLT